MKANKLSYLMAMALALTVVATGCKTKPVGVTRIGNRGTGTPGDLGLGNTIQGDGASKLLAGGGETAPFNLDDYRQDPGALASHTVHFDFDSYVVKSSEQGHVQAVATALGSDNATKLLIEGHCDERGTEEYNRSLGERRALALREALAGMGVDPQRVKTLSFGEDKPAATGSDESAWRQNRRGVFILLHPK